ncbi:putative alpha/beta fold family hydrolase [Paraphaeosphaeria sporulosa]|uniref:Putative alpha/beta fold family hydrolase n=1 Tax=Paraphaeosphaeria sporulosa TaxID=1460663 RepID=A0A177CLN5_9PLEO|nr:putative alpha/beta fold family hydrolase [Paraphaeosphaeria sporulosa]OAG08445.1 putative alpha/beta fold family hydrolase [Paraphaeosphaeria sporulosa]
MRIPKWQISLPVIYGFVAAQNTPLELQNLSPVQYVNTENLRIAYYDSGPKNTTTVLLLHGFPYDINVYYDVVQNLTRHGYRTVVPYLRGFGGTRFNSAVTPRSAEQAALGKDVVDLMDAIGLDRAIIAGYDWGTVAANVAVALWPERSVGMVAANSYLIQNRSTALQPSIPASEALRWYYYVFLTPRGYAGLVQWPKEWARTLWSRNSPQWNFTESDLDRAMVAFDNADYPEIVVNFYRSRLLYTPGDPAYANLADALDAQPKIMVPSVTLDPTDSPVLPPANESVAAKFFAAPRIHHILRDTGENIPQQNPDAFTRAILEVAELARSSGNL